MQPNSSPFNIMSIDRENYQTFVNPNAICPVCGAPVFFYQSEYGGRVFFDELGPPWPKHPCTDSKSEVIKTNIFSNEPSWLKEGWMPFIYQGWDFVFIENRSNIKYHGAFFSVSGFSLPNKIKYNNIIVDCDENFFLEKILFIRELGENNFEFSALSLYSKEVKIIRGFIGNYANGTNDFIQNRI